MAAAKPAPFIIKRPRKRGHAGHSSGMWKIAYADFVTAMMAFFLLMWLLGSTTQGDLEGIADYFQSPLKVAMSGGSGAGDANSVIQGGGPSLTQSTGQVRNGENQTRNRTPEQLRTELVRLEMERMRVLKAKVRAAIEANPRLTEFSNQVRLEITPEGLRVQIVDDFNRPMFDIGSAHLKPYMREILQLVGEVLNQTDAKIVLAGHTDSALYSGGERGYSNWELSTDRANASRRVLVAGGMNPARIVRVVGFADAQLAERADPRSPLNRRISIIVLNRQAVDRMAREGGHSETDAAAELAAPLPESPHPTSASDQEPS